MIENEHQGMADKNRAERFKAAILATGTYEEVAEKSGVSVSTLVRISSGKTDPKLSDAVKIAKITRQNLNDLVYGETKEQQVEAVKSFVTALNGTDEATDEAYRSIIWKLTSLYKEDIQAINVQIQALSEFRHKQRTTERASLKRTYIENLIEKRSDIADMIRKELVENYGFTDDELSEAQLEYEIVTERKRLEKEKEERKKAIEKTEKMFRRPL
ncbi:helix-turn-helix domain-containing protein [Vibrio aestuarianus]|uniref:Helix-turn-helix domain-containing protein n=1 Tax=Vibrio tetraodonis subsp. pristinus TaxID=2695891 RepID=A0A6L8LZW4_9VIBR|nr:MULTISPECIES: helix-turn-helix transcriptional regulator [Vibrio]MDE1314112.1 helix-turn-helix domain-containing protein [Vibrio aestuarianus]MYM58731.1 helix-turn-helix domain-containing protein [Vibrio tetraodonis subsp. pristinus]MYM58742.1 helix-turn-helix domain-containing protein [Vibrio tetraodonis subsp. pristinus]